MNTVFTEPNWLDPNTGLWGLGWLGLPALPLETERSQLTMTFAGCHPSQTRRLMSERFRLMRVNGSAAGNATR